MHAPPAAGGNRSRFRCLVTDNAGKPTKLQGVSKIAEFFKTQREQQDSTGTEPHAYGEWQSGCNTLKGLQDHTISQVKPMHNVGCRHSISGNGKYTSLATHRVSVSAPPQLKCAWVCAELLHSARRVAAVCCVSAGAGHNRQKSPQLKAHAASAVAGPDAAAAADAWPAGSSGAAAGGRQAELRSKAAAGVKPAGAAARAAAGAVPAAALAGGLTGWISGAAQKVQAAGTGAAGRLGAAFSTLAGSLASRAAWHRSPAAAAAQGNMAAKRHASAPLSAEGCRHPKRTAANTAASTASAAQHQNNSGVLQAQQQQQQLAEQQQQLAEQASSAADAGAAQQGAAQCCKEAAWLTLPECLKEWAGFVRQGLATQQGAQQDAQQGKGGAVTVACLEAENARAQLKQAQEAFSACSSSRSSARYPQLLKMCAAGQAVQSAACKAAALEALLQLAVAQVPLMGAVVVTDSARCLLTASHVLQAGHCQAYVVGYLAFLECLHLQLLQPAGEEQGAAGRQEGEEQRGGSGAAASAAAAGRVPASPAAACRQHALQAGRAGVHVLRICKLLHAGAARS